MSRCAYKGIATEARMPTMQPASTDIAMDIHVFANNQQMGPFPKDTVLQMASIGSIPADASVWHDGAKDWYPLGDFVAAHGGATPAPATEQASPDRPAVAVLPNSSLEGPSPTACVIRGVAAGFGTAVACGGAWLALSITTGVWIGYVGLLVGWLVGKATSAASREEGAIILPISAVCFTLLTCAPVLVMRPLSPWVWLSAAFGAFNAWKASAN
jgi:hypothetical protein